MVLGKIHTDMQKTELKPLSWAAKLTKHGPKTWL